MKRILAIIQERMGEQKAERKIKRFFRAIDIATDNATDAIDEYESRIADLAETLPDVTDFENFVQELSSLIDNREEQRAVVERLKEIKAYFEEEVDVE